MKQLVLYFLIILLAGCKTESGTRIISSPGEIPFTWNNATIYFLLTDRFNNGDLGNDTWFQRESSTGINRGFMGGDLAGITARINSGYFTELGVSAIWLTPFWEQVHGLVNEGTGNTYGYHGYWAKDWTTLDPNFGNESDLEELVKTAHDKGIRIIMDVVINHTGPVTDLDPVWGDDWVRTEPRCTYEGYTSTVTCTLVDNLPDIKTEVEGDVMLPEPLLEKWKKEGRLEEELAELDEFFSETGYPRAPKYYIIKWLVDYVRKYGIDGYRLDTAKHTEEGLWAVLRKEADRAFSEWKNDHPDVFPETGHFYMVGEVYNYVISGGRWFDYGDTLVDFFSEGIDHLINFEFKYDATNSYEAIYSKYSEILNDKLEGKGVLNYLSSHDDGSPFDANRTRPFDAAIKLLLAPGAAQIYYGDETSRMLATEGAVGDANLRSFMNWQEIEENAVIEGYSISDILDHYKKLGTFRLSHPSVGAGIHRMISESPYYFERKYTVGDWSDIVVIGLDLEEKVKKVPVKGIFTDGEVLQDAYSGVSVTVEKGMATVESEFPIVLLGKF